MRAGWAEDSRHSQAVHPCCSRLCGMSLHDPPSPSPSSLIHVSPSSQWDGWRLHPSFPSEFPPLSLFCMLPPPLLRAPTLPPPLPSSAPPPSTSHLLLARSRPVALPYHPPSFPPTLLPFSISLLSPSLHSFSPCFSPLPPSSHTWIWILSDPPWHGPALCVCVYVCFSAFPSPLSHPRTLGIWGAWQLRTWCLSILFFLAPLAEVNL